MVKLPSPQAICGEINSYLCSSSCLAIHLYCYVGDKKCVGVDTVLDTTAECCLKDDDYFGLYQVITDDCYGWETKFTPFGRFDITKNLEKGGVKCLSRANKFQDNLMITAVGYYEFGLSLVDGRIMEWYEPGGENDVGGYRLVDLEKLNTLCYFANNVLEQIRTHGKE